MKQDERASEVADPRCRKAENTVGLICVVCATPASKAACPLCLSRIKFGSCGDAMKSAGIARRNRPRMGRDTVQAASRMLRAESGLPSARRSRSSGALSIECLAGTQRSRSQGPQNKMTRASPVQAPSSEYAAMAKEVLIVGGGLSGLYLAHRLKQSDPSYRVTVLESRRRLGGRLESAQTSAGESDEVDEVDEVDAFDLGGSWFWPSSQPLVDSLLAELG